MYNNIVILNPIASVICGLLYALGMSVLILSLNMRTLFSIRSILLLSGYLTIIYICVLFFPLLIGGSLIYLLFSVNETVTVSLLLGSTLIILAVNLIIHLRFHYVLLPRYEFSITGVYSFLIIILGILLLVLRGKYGFGFTSTAHTAFFLTLSVFVLFYLRGFALSNTHISLESEGKPLERCKKMNRKVLWLGIDSATWDIIHPMIAGGKLPNLNRMIEGGGHGSLKTFVPTHSPVVWTTKATGKSPIKHGIRDFLTFDVKGIDGYMEVKPLDPLLSRILSKAANYGLIKRRPVSSVDRKSLAIWNIVSEMGYKVGVVSWFVTDPVEKIDGFMVPEFYYTIGRKRRGSSSAIHPFDIEDKLRSIKKEIEERFNSKSGEDEVKERFSIKSDLNGSERRKFNILKVFYFHDVLRVKVTNSLMDIFDLDMLMVYFHGVDAVQHHFWVDHNKDDSLFKDVIARYYEYLDETIGRLLDGVSDPKTVFITSDHGHGPMKYYKKLYNIIMGREKISGSHVDGPDGIFVAYGDGIQKGVSVKDISVHDVVPTILPVFGLPIGKDMDGRPISEIFDDSIPGITYIPSYEGRLSVYSGDGEDLSEDREIMDRLRDLGYID
ncbi:MAG: alkaline phosphatase family protein [Thermodesulfobacteriota bacterium]|nr:alkaline phosphatase family protein [Thermodesulfobacteriota bacterium]